jgi:hypothetical protein
MLLLALLLILLPLSSQKLTSETMGSGFLELILEALGKEEVLVAGKGYVDESWERWGKPQNRKGAKDRAVSLGVGRR